MRRQDQLIDLIHSLTPSEKRYFKLYNSLQPGNKKYTQLFNALLKMESYDAGAICKALKLTKPQLANDKKYLEQVLVKALRAFNEKNSPEIMLHNAFIDIEVLYTKKQYDMCSDLLKVMKRTCDEYDFFAMKMECSKWELRIDAQTDDKTKRYKEIKEIHQAEVKVLEQLRNYWDYLHLQNMMYSKIYRRGVVQSPQIASEMEEIMNSPLMQDKSKAISFQSMTSYYQTAIWFTLSNSKLEECMDLTVGLVDWYQKHIRKVLHNPIQYARVLSSGATNLTILGRYTDARRCARLLEKLPHMKGVLLNGSRKTEITRLTVEMNLMIYFIRHEYTKAIKYFQKTYPLMVPDETNWDTKFYTHYYHVASLCFFRCGQYEEALKYLRKLIDDKGKKKWAESMIGINMLHVMVHFELGNFELVPYLLKSLKQYLLKAEFQTKSIVLFIKMFSELIKHPFKKDQILIFKKFQPEFDALRIEYVEKAMQDGAGLQLWIIKKLQES